MNRLARRAWPLAAAVALCPTPAWAYLDPGTGNILIYLLISLVTAGVYFAKSVGYAVARRLSGNGKAVPAQAGDDDLVLFSEGKIYWATFKPVIEALLARDYPFRYLSMDLEDPALTIEHPRMHSRYIGAGSAAFARAAGVRGRVMLQTTANIGTPGYPMPVPRHIACLAHVLHGVGGLSMYYKNAHDTCNVIFLMGDKDHESVRLLEKKRGLAPREIVSAGVPCFDELARSVTPKQGRSDPAVILVAPSWGEKSCLAYCGTDFILWLAQAGYEIIVRPHPFSLKVERAAIAAIEERFAELPNVRFDLDVDGGPSLRQADMMISDKSGVRFDFGFLYERPVLTLDVPLKNQENFEISELDYVWENDMEARLGPVISVEAMAALDAPAFLDLVRRTLATEPDHLAALRDENVAHFRHSGEFIADWVINRCRELAAPQTPDGSC